MTRIIGIDPGSRITGYGVIEVGGRNLRHIDCGGIHIPEKKPIEGRLLFIHQKIRDIFTKFNPDHASIEDLFFAKNAKSTLMLGQVRGIILLALAEMAIPYSIYPPKEVKKAVTGYGSASKEQIQYMVKKLLGLTETAFEDASDALAIAICHSTAINLQNRLKK